MFDELHNMSMCSNDLVLILLYLYICVETVDMYSSVVGDSCSIMANDYELRRIMILLLVMINVSLKLIHMIVFMFGTCG